MRILFFLVSIALFSCKEQVKKQNQEVATSKNEKVKTIENPANPDSQTPNLFSNDNGLWMSWISTKDDIDYLKFSKFDKNTWQETKTVTSGTDWFVNWADFPAIAVNDDQILTNILKMSDTGTYTYDVKLNLLQTVKRSGPSDAIPRKLDFILHDDGTKSEHGFVSLQPYGERSFYAVWLDGRNTGGSMDHDSHSGHGGAMTLRGAIVTDTGEIRNDEALDNRVCDCCQTDLVVTKDKQVIVAYRDRSDDEIRDIKIKKRDKNGDWSSPIIVGNDNWKITGCPVNGPALASYTNTYAVAWFSEAKNNPKVQLSFGNIDRNTLEPPITINSNPTIGRIDLTMISDTQAVVSWIEDVGDDTLIQLIKVDKNGAKGDVLTVSKTNAARASGFPRMAVDGENIVIAYTMLEKDKPSRIEIKTLTINEL